MIRRTNRYKDSQKVYYICSTKNRGEGCSRHSIEEEKMKELVLEMVRKYANCFLEEERIFEQALKMETNFESIVHYDSEIARLKEQQDKYYALCPVCMRICVMALSQRRNLKGCIVSLSEKPRSLKRHRKNRKT